MTFYYPKASCLAAEDQTRRGYGRKSHISLYQLFDHFLPVALGSNHGSTETQALLSLVRAGQNDVVQY